MNNPLKDNVTRILRLHEVKRRTGLSGTTIWRRRREGSFPSPVDLGNGILGWYEDEIEIWIKARPRVSIAAAAVLLIFFAALALPLVGWAIA